MTKPEASMRHTAHPARCGLNRYRYRDHLCTATRLRSYV